MMEIFNRSVGESVEHVDDNQELLQLEALLLARTYAYELMGKLLGGVPDEDILQIVLSETTTDVIEELAGASDELMVFAEFLSSLREKDFATVLDGMKDEYGRMLIGPAALPASPYESPYTGSHDTALFQSNTLAVRHDYERAGLVPKRVQAIPDDHIAMMLSFMAKMSMRTFEAFLAGDLKAMECALTHQRAFSNAHMGSWLDVFAASVRNSKVGERAVFYPQLLEAVSAFTKADRSFLTEASYWVSEQESIGKRNLAEILEGANSTLCIIQDLMPLGVADFEMVSV